MLQLWKSTDVPMHSFPPLTATRAFFLFRVCNPPPHVFEHDDQLPKLPHIQLMTCGAKMIPILMLVNVCVPCNYYDALDIISKIIVIPFVVEGVVSRQALNWQCRSSVALDPSIVQLALSNSIKVLLQVRSLVSIPWPQLTEQLDHLLQSDQLPTISINNIISSVNQWTLS